MPSFKLSRNVLKFLFCDDNITGFFRATSFRSYSLYAEVALICCMTTPVLPATRLTSVKDWYDQEILRNISSNPYQILS
jgi:hypothetical protein